ncbi:hypothetical protein J31TS3_22190 [Paenibacillus lactis]|nr:hypothetical protein J31TS3_22190 [Paenibacillus lactis]
MGAPPPPQNETYSKCYLIGEGDILMGDVQIQSLIENYLNAYNSFDIEGMIRLLHDDIEFRNVNNGVVDTETKGIEQFRALAEQSLTIFSQRCQTMKQITITGDKAEIEVDYEGVLAVDLPNGMKAGESLKLTGRSMFLVQDDKLRVIEDYS